MGNKIFISYRREDSNWSTGRIYDRLAKHFSEEQLFLDVNSISPGDDFVSYIEESVNGCDLLLAVIGQRWLQLIQSKSHETDFVRLEISAALKNNIRVIPILVEDTRMPSAEELPDELKALARKNAFLVTPASFTSEMETLIQRLQKFFLQKEVRLEEERQKVKKEMIAAQVEQEKQKEEEEEQRRLHQAIEEKQQRLLPKDFQGKQEIINRLRQLLTEGGNDNFLIASIKDVYVQFAGEKGNRTLYCETVSNESLPKAYKLKADQIEKLMDLGFNRPAGRSPNYFMEYKLENDGDLEQLSQITGSVFFTVYSFPEGTRISFQLNLA